MDSREIRFIKKLYKGYKIILIVIIVTLILGIILGSHIVDMIFNINFISDNYTRGEVLSYYGVVITGVITFIALSITINNNSKDIRKQFYYSSRQRYITDIENQIKDAILYLNNIDDMILNLTNNLKGKNLSDLNSSIDTYFYLECIKNCEDVSTIIIELKKELAVRNYIYHY